MTDGSVFFARKQWCKVRVTELREIDSKSGWSVEEDGTVNGDLNELKRWANTQVEVINPCVFVM
jgi:hypothetical protein